MQLALKTCSGCVNWTGYKQVVDDVIAATCAVRIVPNASLGTQAKVTKGSDSCGKWASK